MDPASALTKIDASRQIAKIRRIHRRTSAHASICRCWRWGMRDWADCPYSVRLISKDLDKCSLLMLITCNTHQSVTRCHRTSSTVYIHTLCSQEPDALVFTLDCISFLLNTSLSHYVFALAWIGGPFGPCSAYLKHLCSPLRRGESSSSLLLACTVHHASH